jgi:DNA-directed RNA polymerase subunit RPC12/RpoP
VDKTVGDVCPRCGCKTLDVYFEEGTDLELGARCEECGLKGFFLGKRLIPLATS